MLFCEAGVAVDQDTTEFPGYLLSFPPMVSRGPERAILDG